MSRVRVISDPEVRLYAIAKLLAEDYTENVPESSKGCLKGYEVCRVSCFVTDTHPYLVKNSFESGKIDFSEGEFDKCID